MNRRGHRTVSRAVSVKRQSRDQAPHLCGHPGVVFERVEDVDVKILLCLAVEPRKAKPFTRFANLPCWCIFWVHLYERIESRKLARLRCRSGDCARIEPARSARRSARADGPKWLWKKHSGQGFGRASRLPRDRR